MAGYNYISGVGDSQPQGGGGGMGGQGIPQAPNIQLNNPMLGAPMAGMSGGSMGSGYNPVGPNAATSAQYQQSSTFVPGYGYLNGNDFTNQSLNSSFIQDPRHANTNMGSINAINNQMGGYQLGSNQAGLGGLNGVQTQYGFIDPSAGGGNGSQGLGQSFDFGGQQYAGTQAGIAQALANYNSLVKQYNDIPQINSGMYSNPAVSAGYGPGLSNAASLQDAYTQLGANPGMQYFTGVGNNGAGGGSFTNFYNDPSMQHNNYGNINLTGTQSFGNHGAIAPTWSPAAGNRS